MYRSLPYRHTGLSRFVTNGKWTLYYRWPKAGKICSGFFECYSHYKVQASLHW